MFKGIINTDTAVATETNVPFVVSRNTNGNTRYLSATNEVQINTPGNYNVFVNLVASASADVPITARLFVDGVAVDGSGFTVVPAATGDTWGFALVDCLKVQPTLSADKVKLSVQLDQAVTVNSGVMVVEKVR